jgi:lactose/L-arabinose transport system permease protein
MRRPLAIPYLFLAPYLTVFAVFWAWPIVQSILLSFKNTRSSPWRFDLLFNWGRLFNDPAFVAALKNTILILVVQVPVMLALAIGLALALNSSLLRARGIFRFAFFAPVVVGEVAYSAVFRLLFNGDFGAVNGVLGTLGLPMPAWLTEGWTAMAVVMLAITWRWTGYNAIIILAGLQNIPRDLYEAAAVDGIPRWRQHLSITLPLLRPVILFALVLSIIGTMQLFAEPWLITQGGPGNATETLGTYLYKQGFRAMNFGYASTVAYAMALMAAFFSAVQIMLFGRRQ